jgi:hypothetical protein
MSILSLIPTGIEHKISSSELAKNAGCKNIRELRAMIERERLSGAVICSTAEDGGGYFLHENVFELRQHVNTIEAKARNTWKSNAAARAALRELERE